MPNTLKPKIRKLIQMIGGKLDGEIENPKIEFGFKFRYPNPQIGRGFSIVKPKKKTYIEIFSTTKLSQEHKNAFLKLKESKKKKFIQGIHRITLQNNLTINLQFKKEQAFAIIEKIYFNEDTHDLDLNFFYEQVRRIFSCVLLCVMFIQDSLSGDYDPEDYADNPPLYT
jgi:hypothetical protein